MSTKLILLIGKSGAGKDTILKPFITMYHSPVFITTRPMRLNEKDGVDYIFVSEDYFASLIESNKLLEYRSYNTINGVYRYGLLKTSLLQNSINILIGDLRLYQNLKNIFTDDSLITIYIDADDNIRKQRAMSRSDFNIDEWNRRLQDDNKIYTKDVISNFNYIVKNNGDLKDTLIEINHIIQNQIKKIE